MEPTLDRRTFLAAAATGAGGLLLPAPLADDRAAARRRSRLPLAREVAFPQGVASGQPGTSGITLWTKVAGPGARRAPAGRDLPRRGLPPRDLPQASADARAQRVRDPPPRPALASLKPGERYHYRFVSCTVDGPVGRFTTARPADSREPARIGFFSCQDYESGYYTAHAALAEEDDLDLVICLGDYIYEKHYDDAPVRKDTTGANRDAEVQTLPEYRDKYALYHSDANLRAMRAAHPLLAIWDDHEVEDNWAGDKPGRGHGETRACRSSSRRANGFQAFFEHMPRRARRRRPRPHLRLAADRRQRRAVPARPALLPRRPALRRPALRPLHRRRGARPHAARRRPEGSGSCRGLAASTATWKIVGNQVMVMSLDAARRATRSTPTSGTATRPSAARSSSGVARRGTKDVTVRHRRHPHVLRRPRDAAAAARGSASRRRSRRSSSAASITSKGVADSGHRRGRAARPARSPPTRR